MTLIELGFITLNPTCRRIKLAGHFVSQSAQIAQTPRSPLIDK
jgi:hypothetical protein